MKSTCILVLLFTTVFLRSSSQSLHADDIHASEAGPEQTIAAYFKPVERRITTVQVPVEHENDLLDDLYDAGGRLCGRVISLPTHLIYDFGKFLFLPHVTLKDAYRLVAHPCQEAQRIYEGFHDTKEKPEDFDFIYWHELSLQAQSNKHKLPEITDSHGQPVDRQGNNLTDPFLPLVRTVLFVGGLYKNIASLSSHWAVKRELNKLSVQQAGTHYFFPVGSYLALRERHNESDYFDKSRNKVYELAMRERTASNDKDNDKEISECSGLPKAPLYAFKAGLGAPIALLERAAQKAAVNVPWHTRLFNRKIYKNRIKDALYDEMEIIRSRREQFLPVKNEILKK